MMKPTVHDIAECAGVSLATVDRVLNARPGVRDKTVARVQDAVRTLGYVRDITAANLARQRTYRFAFLLPDGASAFVAAIRDALTEAAAAMADDRITPVAVAVAAHDPHSVVEALHSLASQGYDGAALMAPETPQLRDAVARLRASGTPVVALVSDLPNSGRDHFVGINNIAAGRTAAQIMIRFLRSGTVRVLVIAGSMLARDSIERRLGFDAVVAEAEPAIRVLPSLETHDDPDRVIAAVTAAFASHPDIAGIYSMASENAALIGHLACSGHADRVVVVHELTPAARDGLLTGTVDAVITQDVGHLVRSAMRVLRAKCDDRQILESQERIRVEIMLKENLPPA